MNRGHADDGRCTLIATSFVVTKWIVAVVHQTRSCLKQYNKGERDGKTTGELLGYGCRGFNGGIMIFLEEKVNTEDKVIVRLFVDTYFYTYFKGVIMASVKYEIRNSGS